ncbi:MAG: 2Fe-2S iron-sulfur cluster binding domain-containing protein [Polaromonas sp.]|jgi:ferredoxin|uniref:2Fe-2S iron-sulfur cluster-binding protein n=1 Tax=Polaromonas sp. TaxID=1869339 RepID=UPI00272F3780|nr:2Fe-2S iron-sulfur cluster binding domain-containing protein [Polaromonas sp.]MDP2256521.1 2Fe-2S iron-sulfur cluster binding domain-containing protein [Polaromonas sp.]MDP3707714.1 2Fe-2S iron-sulfur cluster binding domain-containing protein [Polaromonas sp.]
MVQVPAGSSLLNALLDAGMTPNYSCKDGLCGACETKILSGEVEHHDSILTKKEQAANKSMMICVSRCRRGPLVLDM